MQKILQLYTHIQTHILQNIMPIGFHNHITSINISSNPQSQNPIGGEV